MAASAAASSLLPNAISSSMTRPHASTDSRLLQNLIKAEKGYTNHLAATVTSSQAAASALLAWGTSEARDVANTSAQLAELLSQVVDAQATHLEAIRGYREALKDVADREASIRTIVRDRDILVSRLIKASKKNGDVAHAQRELTACEEVLQAEERALVGVKRRTFKEALSMRMKTMGDAGNQMIESAKEAIMLLDRFDQHAIDDGRRPSHADGEQYADYQDDSNYPYDNSEQVYDHAGQQQTFSPEPDYQGVHPGYTLYDPQAQPQGQVSDAYASNDQHQFAGLENASVTPSQSASQNNYGSRLAQQNTGGTSYQRPAYARGALDKTAEERADSDASSEAGDLPDQGPDVQRHVNSFGASPQAPNPPSKNAGGNATSTSAAANRGNAVNHAEHSAAQQEASARPPREAPPPGPQPQMFSATAPSFNYDGVNVGSVPQAPRTYQRDDASSSDEEDTARHRSAGKEKSSYAARSSQYGQGNNQSSNGYAQRPKSEKRRSFLGRVSSLFKTDVRDTNNGTNNSRDSRHGRQPSDASRQDDSHGRSGHPDSNWSTRTDRNLKDAGKDNQKALGTQPRAGLQQPLAPEEESSDDEERRTDLVKVNNAHPQWSGKKGGSDVGGTLRRTPSEIARITAGPMSSKQRQELEARQQADFDQRTRDAVMGAGVAQQGAAGQQPSATAASKKKKKNRSSTTGSEIGTSSTRQALSSQKTPTASSHSNTQPHGSASSNYVVQGDQSSGHRGLAHLVLPSDLSKPDRPYPSVMPPTGLPQPQPTLGRSNSTNTAGGRASITSKGTAKKKKRHSAISEGYGTGLTAMSPKDAGKYTTNSWIPQPQGGQGLAAQAVGAAGVVPHKPASGAEIARKQTVGSQGQQSQQTTQRNDTSKALAPPSTNGLPNENASSSPMRPSTSQQSTPLKSALKHPGSIHRSASPAPASASTALEPAIAAPPKASAVLAEAERPISQPVTASAPQLPEMQEQDETELDPERSSEPPRLPLATDENFDGSGRLDMSRGSSTEGDVPSAQPSAPRQQVALPRLDMPESEPFNVSFGQGSSDGAPAAVQVRQSSIDDALLTPGERAAYQGIIATPAGPEMTKESSQPEGVTRTLANRVRVGGNAQSDSPAAASDTDSEEAGVETGATSQSTLPPQPSRTYSSENRNLPMANSPAPAQAPQEPVTAPNTTSDVPESAAPAVPQAPLSDLSGGAVSRRKSVRLAPDTKLPPETSAPVQQHRRESDGFGGFRQVHHGESAAPAKTDEQATHWQLSSRIAPPPQAPPRLPTKDTFQGISTPDRERSSWTSRIDRRLANANDSSDDEDATAGDGIDAYASARRAMGASSKSWKDAISPGKKSKKSASGGDSGSVRSKGSKKKKGSSNYGYNPEVPLPKGMEVVGRQKATRG
ncbi:unnamed protein product [Jaminaea pallidilutea]